MARTYQGLNINEVRAVQLTLNDQTGVSFIPSAAYATILDSSNAVVIAEQDAMVSGNDIYIIIGTTVTSTVGKYLIKWKLLKDGHTYYHATDLEVYDL